MGTAVVAVIAFAIVLGASFTALGDLVGLNNTASSALQSSWRDAELRVDSSIVPSSATLSGSDLDVVIENRGRLKYAEPELGDWVVVVRYEDSGGTARVEFMEYASALSAGTWTVDQIYLDEPTSTIELTEPDILNPEEEMVIRARLSNTPGASTINQVSITPPEGGAGTVHFDG